MTSVMASLVLISEIDECGNDQCNGFPCYDFIDRLDECANDQCNSFLCFDFRDRRVCQ